MVRAPELKLGRSKDQYSAGLSEITAPGAAERGRRLGGLPFAKQRMQRRPPFGAVDRLAREQRCASLGEPARLGERDQCRQRIGVEALAAEIEQQAAGLARKSREAARILREEPRHGTGRETRCGRSQRISQDS